MARLGRERRAWQAGDHYRRFMAVLSSVAVPPPRIRNIVAFACSTMDCAHDNNDNDKLPSDAQHALPLAIREFLLSAKGYRDLYWNVQDPMYTDADKQVLQSLGVTVLDDPRAFLQVDDATAVLSVSPDTPVRRCPPSHATMEQGRGR